MVKSELVDAVADIHKNVPKRDIETIVETVFDCMTDAMVRDERVEIRGFGSFTVRIRNAREGRNPKTGEVVFIPKKRSPFFAVGKELKERVDAGRRR